MKARTTHRSRQSLFLRSIQMNELRRAMYWLGAGAVLLPLSVAQSAETGGSASVSGNQAPITEVVVYPGVAMVQREARISATTRQLSFECLPASIDAQSLQISADNGVRVGDFKVLMQARKASSKDCTSPLDQQIRTLEDQLAAIEAEEGAAKLVGDYLQGITKPGDEGNKSITASQIGATSQALRQTSRDNTVRAHQIQRQKQDLLTQLQPLQAERDRTGSQQSQVMKVTVQLASRSEANVRLNYQVRGPSWQPSYRAQLNTGKATVQLERQALVVQNSGEDWSNVRLRLSTGQPTRSTRGSLPRPWVVDIAQPTPPMAAAPAPAPIMMERSGKNMTAMAPEMPQLDVSSINTAYTTQFVVPYKISVPSSAERLTLSLGNESVATSLLTRAAPAAEEAAYLIATLKAPAGIWPAGPAALFRDDAFVGNGHLDFGNARALAQGLSFGRDDKVIVRRLEQEANTGSTGFIASKTEQTVARRYSVENRHDQAIALQVLDTAPISRNEQIRVQSQYAPQPSNMRWNEQNGMIAWEQTLDAGRSAEFKATHQIRYPENAMVQGLQ